MVQPCSLISSVTKMCIRDRYLVFFKGRDADVLTAAFREFSKKKLDKERKPSVRRDLAEKKAEAAQTAKRDKVKNMDRGIDR